VRPKNAVTITIKKKAVKSNNNSYRSGANSEGKRDAAISFAHVRRVRRRRIRHFVR
jgi:hypothetical protein